MKRRKYELPIVFHLKHIEINLEKLQEAFKKIENNFCDVMEANPSLCENHSDLVSKVYDNFDQINLTELNGVAMPFTSNIKERIKRREECLYNKPTKDFIGSYFEDIVRQFKSPAMRVRITRLAGGSEIPFHIDYDPTYATRIIIPIISNPKVLNQFIVRNETQEFYLKPGCAYFLNTGFSHAVFNSSDEDRVALMFSLDGQDDLSEI